MNVFYLPFYPTPWGFGSNFNHDFMVKLFASIYLNQRIILVMSHNRSSWKYDCQDQLGWACYLKFNCVDSFVNVNSTIKPFIKQQRINESQTYIDIYTQAGGALIDIYKAMAVGVSSEAICNISDMTPSNVASVATQYLWQLNDNVSQWLQLHTPAYNLVENEYIAFQIRLTDKRREMGVEAWRILSNSSALVELALPYIIERNISNIFVATDDCQAFKWLRRKFHSRKKLAHVQVVGACLDFEEGKDVSDYTSHSGGGAMHLIQDIEILRRSAVLIGTLYSNVLRIAYRLRYPDHRVVNVADEYFSLNKASMTDIDGCCHFMNVTPGSMPC
jgi:hypothetical protein